MSGDVQPRKRKEKRRKKDELGIEELRGTAAVFGEGDVLIHSYHEHGTGGHWCAKIIFFSLLAVLVTLIGLIILENRGLSELEANAVESRYSGVLDGWIEDAPYDDHHDEHTLELKRHATDENAVEEGEEVSEEIEKIEKEVLDEEVPISDEVTHKYNDVEDKNTDKKDFKEDENEDESSFEDEEMTEPPVVEQITVPPGKPFVELEDETSSEKPTNTLDEEEEYEKRQEQLRLEKEESSSKIWLKLVVGGALLVATHAVIRRSTAPRDTPENEANARKGETPSVIDRRMTLIPNELTPLPPAYEPPQEEQVKKIISGTKKFQSVPIQKQESDEDQEVLKKLETEEVTTEEAKNDVLDKELYSDDDEEVDDEEIMKEKKEYPKESSLDDDDKGQEESETEEVPDDVEIIDDEQIEEEIEEEVEDEEDISDVDDAELLSRLEAKYGRLPEPDRPESKHKDGGNNVENEWPGEPSDPYWRQQLDYAEQEIRQDWLD